MRVLLRFPVVVSCLDASTDSMHCDYFLRRRKLVVLPYLGL